MSCLRDAMPELRGSSLLGRRASDAAVSIYSRCGRRSRGAANDSGTVCVAHDLREERCMLRMFVFLGLAVMGCGTQRSGPIRFDISIDTSAAPTAVFVAAYYAFGTPSSMPIATPNILAGTAPPAGTAMTWSGRELAEAGIHGQPIGF